MLTLIKRMHNFFVRQALYPLILSTLFTFILLTGRIYISGSWIYLFLVWNLFLAWIPYGLSLGMAYTYAFFPRVRWLLIVPALVWLIFLPNAPYLITDFLHLQERSGIPLWYDIMLFCGFAWTGLFLAVFSLRAMQDVVKLMAGTLISWLFVLGMLGLTGLGVYLGRFLRWNSWDLLFQPKAIASDVATRLVQPWEHPSTVGVTLIFALFLLVCYLTITTTRSTGEVELERTG